MKPVKFRPHHFLCALGFQGKGYSPDFIQNFSKIVELLRGPDGDAQLIEVVDRTDDICSPCPNRTATTCSSELKIRRLDDQHRRLLEIHSGQFLTWGEAKGRIAEKVTLKKFHEACEPCSWRSLGVCESALQTLRSEKESE